MYLEYISLMYLYIGFFCYSIIVFKINDLAPFSIKQAFFSVILLPKKPLQYGYNVYN